MTAPELALRRKILATRGGHDRHNRCSRSLLASSANKRLHVIEITFEGAAPCRGEAVFRLGQPAVKHFGAIDVSSFLELAGVHGEIRSEERRVGKECRSG